MRTIAECGLRIAEWDAGARWMARACCDAAAKWLAPFHRARRSRSTFRAVFFPVDRPLRGRFTAPGLHLALVVLMLLFCFALNAGAQTNLVPNADFRAVDPLQSWRIDFPYAGPYVNNKNYVSVTSENAPQGGKSVRIELPPGVAGNEGGKIESAFIPAEPGATYRVEIDCLTWNFSAKTYVEAWVADPKPIPQPDKFRVPAGDGHPALLTVYRAQIPDPAPRSKTWETVRREFTLPKSVRVAGKETPPEYLTLKAYTYEGTPKGGKSYFANFRLTKIKSAQ